jgi:hypothetical protein
VESSVVPHGEKLTVAPPDLRAQVNSFRNHKCYPLSLDYAGVVADTTASLSCDLDDAISS